MFRSLTPWPRLVREGIPPLAVIRKPLAITAELTLEIGSAFPVPKDRKEELRARQLYDQRRIAPGEGQPPPNVIPLHETDSRRRSKKK